MRAAAARGARAVGRWARGRALGARQGAGRAAWALGARQGVGCAGWLRAVHSVHSACFRSDSTRYFS